MSRPPEEPPLVYIVDDDEYIRRALTRLVESLGLRAEAYAAPVDLLDRRRWEEPDCLVLDVQMPGMGGFELYEVLLEEGLETPVVFVTGQPRPDTYERAARANAIACLEKPFDLESLERAIRQALDAGSARRP